jgi:hypothetical protein
MGEDITFLMSTFEERRPGANVINIFTMVIY